ncbi:MAG: DNA mismatch repair endonuclease MutL, partial [Firmicutes bacterium]|nr:DNA mismatch repair endonuclease MutL [Bacillota bacterium]
MNKILVLEKNTRDQIAAGEVAERPALIIKELIENAIDADATDIRIHLKESGIEEIRIIDNGSGIEKEDIPNAFLRHATSKIKKIEDLDSLITMGFRGEALASIAAVSKIKIRTKTAENDSAFECTLEGGEISEIMPAAGNNGTEIVIHDLFFNTPARKKFLATPIRELREISDIVGRIIIAYPNIRFELVNDGKKVFLSPGNNDMNAAIAAVYGTEPLRFLLPLKEHENFTGFICHPNYSKPKRSYYHFYINHRYIISSELNKALENAYKTLLPERRFPLAFVNVVLP